MMDIITKLIQTKKTVFRSQQLREMFSDISKKSFDQILYRAKKQGKLLNPQRGLRTLPVFNHEELACQYFPEGYISLESVLYDAGVSFQRYGNATTMVASRTADIYYQEHNYTSHKIKNLLLFNETGVRQHTHYRKATTERALCDLVYLRPGAHFEV